MKRMTSIIFALALCFGLSVPALAAEDTPPIPMEEALANIGFCFDQGRGVDYEFLTEEGNAFLTPANVTLTEETDEGLETAKLIEYCATSSSTTFTIYHNGTEDDGGYISVWLWPYELQPDGTYCFETWPNGYFLAYKGFLPDYIDPELEDDGLIKLYAGEGVRFQLPECWDDSKTIYQMQARIYYPEYNYSYWKTAYVTVDPAGVAAGLKKLEAGAAPAAPTVTKAATSAATGKPVITWDAVEDATGYEIHVSDSSKGTYRLLETMDADTLSFTHKNAEAGNDYYYKVLALNGERKGELSAAKGVWCDLPRPTNFKVTNRASDGKPVISWDAVEGATGYKVYRCGTSGGSYTLMYTAEADKLSVTHTGAAVGNDYFYKVMAVYGDNDKCNSALTAAKGVWVDLKQPTVTVKNRISDGKPYISWEAVDYAVKYQVYVSETSGGAYRLLYTTPDAKKLNVAHTGAKAENDYFYKVRAVHKNSKCTGALSAAKGVWCDLQRPELSVELNAKGKPVISWDAVEGADGYKIYRSTTGKAGSWHLMYTAKANKLSVTHTGAADGTTCYYKAFAVSNVNAKAGSQYSEVVSIKAGK